MNFQAQAIVRRPNIRVRSDWSPYSFMLAAQITLASFLGFVSDQAY
jgi:hypothetical protein